MPIIPDYTVLTISGDSPLTPVDRPERVIIMGVPGPPGPTGATGPAGPLSSVGLSMPVEFSVANTPLTSNGTLIVTKATGGANLFWATPSTGPGQPSLRAITNSDLPIIDTAHGGLNRSTVINPNELLGTVSGSDYVGFTISASTGIILDIAGTTITLSSTGNGTVTSVGLIVPSEFTVTNSPITSAGDITLTKASQSANTGWLAPDGSNGQPSFRSLVNNDLPIVDTQHGGLGLSSILSASSIVGVSASGLTYQGYFIEGEAPITVTYTSSSIRVAAAGAGSGTVTSVGLTPPDGFTVSNSPVTTSGNLILNLGTQSPNLVLAGPTGNTTGSVSWRRPIHSDLLEDYAFISSTITLTASSSTLNICSLPSSSYTIYLPTASSCPAKLFTFKRDQIGPCSLTTLTTGIELGNIVPNIGLFTSTGSSFILFDKITGLFSTSYAYYVSTLDGTINNISTIGIGGGTQAGTSAVLTPSGTGIYFTTQEAGANVIGFLPPNPPAFTNPSPTYTVVARDARGSSLAVDPNESALYWVDNINSDLVKTVLPSLSLTVLDSSVNYSQTTIAAGNGYIFAPTTSPANEIRVWNIGLNSLQTTIIVPITSISVLKYDSYNNRIICTGTGSNNTVFVYDATTFNLVGSFSSPSSFTSIGVDNVEPAYYIHKLNGDIVKYSTVPINGFFPALESISNSTSYQIVDIFTTSSNQKLIGTSYLDSIKILKCNPLDNQLIVISPIDTIDNSYSSYSLDQTNQSFSIVSEYDGLNYNWQTVSDHIPVLPIDRGGTGRNNLPGINRLFGIGNSLDQFSSFNVYGSSGISVTFSNSSDPDQNSVIISASSLSEIKTLTFAAPSEFNVTGSPLSQSGTITLSKANQLANTGYMGPISGSAAAPTFRQLVQNDLPVIPPNNQLMGVNASGSYQGYSLVAGDGIGIIRSDAASSITISLGGSGTSNIKFQARLSSSPNSPISGDGGDYGLNGVAITSIYLHPYGGNLISLCDSSSTWTDYSLSTIPSLNITTAGASAQSNYDVYVYNNNGTPTLELEQWYTITASNNPGTGANRVIALSDTSQFAVNQLVGVGSSGSSADLPNIVSITATSITVSQLNINHVTPKVYSTIKRSSGAEPVKLNGVFVKSNNITRRFIGTIRCESSNGIVDDNEQFRFVWNYHNRVKKVLTNSPSSSSWTYNTATWRPVNNSSSRATLHFVTGFPEKDTSGGPSNIYNSCDSPNKVSYTIIASQTGAKAAPAIGISKNDTRFGTNSNLLIVDQDTVTVGDTSTFWVEYLDFAALNLSGYSPIGLSMYTAMELGVATGTTTWHYDDLTLGGVGVITSSLTGEVWC